MNVVKREIAQLFKMPISYGCMILYACILLMGILEDLSIGTGISSNGWFQQYWYAENFSVGQLVSPLIFPIAISEICAEEQKGHYSWLVLMRSGYKKYCIQKLSAAIVESIILYTVSIFLAVCVGSILFPTVLEASTAKSLAASYPGGLWEKLAMKMGYWFSFFLYVLLNSLNIGIFSIMAICVSVFSVNRYVIAALPFFLSRLGSYAGGWLAKITYTPFGKEWDADGGSIRCIAVNGIAYLILSLMFVMALKWRRRHG